MYNSELGDRLLSRFEALAAENGRLTQRLTDMEQELHNLKVEQARPFVTGLVPLLVMVMSDPKNRIGHIKELRRVANLPLKEAKELMDEVHRLVQEKEDIPF